MDKTLVSIVIPACNEERCIVQCLQSLKAQSYQGPVEIIVCDNNSSDKTGDLARNEGVTVVFEPNPGVIPTRQTGTMASKGDIIIQTDADTTFPVTWLDTIMKTFENNPDIAAVSGSFRFINGPWWGGPFSSLLFGITNIIYKTTGRLIYVPGSNTAFRRRAWHGYDMTLDQGGDEVALLKQFRKEGGVIFLKNNTVLTSARRLKRGLLYNIFVTLIFYNMIEYNYRRLTGKKLRSFPRSDSL